VGRRLWWRLRWRFTSRPFWVRLGNGLPVRIPHGGGALFIYYAGWSEPDLAAFLERRVEPGHVVLDIGAHIGEFTLLAAARGATVHAFEPDPANATLLRANVARNDFQSRVTVHEYAVSDHEGEMRFLAHHNPSLSALWTEQHAAGPASTVRVRVRRLDSIELSRVDVIKIDTEGAELAVLRGAARLLATFSPIVVFEFSPAQYARFDTTPRQVLDELSRHGFRVTDLAGEPFETWPDDLVWTNLVASKTPIS
jgi:FkbM family methyltransferase